MATILKKSIIQTEQIAPIQQLGATLGGGNGQVLTVNSICVKTKEEPMPKGYHHPQLTKTFFIKHFDDEVQTQGILNVNQNQGNLNE